MAPPRALIDLPEMAVDEILSHLPIEDAVRTSVLSRSWRDRWRSIPGLDLRSRRMTWFVVTQILLQHSGPIHIFRTDYVDNASVIGFWIEILTARAASTLRVLDISRPFSIHRPPNTELNIQLLAISRRFPNLTELRLYGCSLQAVDFNSDGLSAFASLKTLELKSVEFYRSIDGNPLSLYVPACPSLETLIVEGARYYDCEVRVGGRRYYNCAAVFSCDLFSVARNCPRLMHLEIYGCELQNVTGSEFSAAAFLELQTLNLCETRFTDKLSALLPACPLLETLIVRPDGLVCCVLHSIACRFPRLTHLELSDCCLEMSADFSSGFSDLQTLSFERVVSTDQLSGFISACPLMEKLVLKNAMNARKGVGLNIDCPNLRELTLFEDYSGHEFAITSALVLKKVSVDVCESASLNTSRTSAEHNYVVETVWALPCIEELRLGSLTLQFLSSAHIPERIPTSFNHLTIMTLDVNFRDVGQLSVTLRLLRSAVNLCRLVLWANNDDCLYDGKVVGHFWASQEHLKPLKKLERVEMHCSICPEAELNFIQFVLAKAQVLKTMIIQPSSSTNKELIMAKISDFLVVSDQAQIKFEDCQLTTEGMGNQPRMVTIR